MKKYLIASSILAATTGAALAGGYAAPVAEPAPMAPAPVIAPAGDWTGFYVGAQLGYGNADEGVNDTGAVGGVHAGYLYDMGRWVAGGELAYSGADINDTPRNGKIDSFTDLKLIAGMPQGQYLVYGGLGASHIKGDLAGGIGASDTVPMAAVGVKYLVRPNMTVGAEFDYRHGNDFDNSGQDLNLSTLSLTTSFKF